MSVLLFEYDGMFLYKVMHIFHCIDKLSGEGFRDQDVTSWRHQLAAVSPTARIFLPYYYVLVFSFGDNVKISFLFHKEIPYAISNISA